MAIIVKTKSKKQEKAVKDFLNNHDIEFQTYAAEEAAPYIIKSSKKKTAKEKQILNNLDQSVDFVNKYKKGKIKSKSFNQLLNEL